MKEFKARTKIRFEDDKIVFDISWVTLWIIAVSLNIIYIQPPIGSWMLVLAILAAWVRGIFSMVRARNLIGVAALVVTIFQPWVPFWASVFVPRSMAVTSWGARTVGDVAGNKLLVAGINMLFVAWINYPPVDWINWTLLIGGGVLGFLTILGGIAYRIDGDLTVELDENLWRGVKLAY